jgi:RNA polymerase sigma factor for flagellar operon FliA
MLLEVLSPKTENLPAAASGRSSSASSNRLTAGELQRNHQIERYFPLVDRVVTRLRRKFPQHVNPSDLRSAGITGLIAAAERFVPAQASTFEGYAYLRIQGAILDELRRIDPRSRLSRQRAKQMEAATHDMMQEDGRCPTDAELSARLQISETELGRWRDAAETVKVISLDFDSAPEGSSSGSLHEVIADENQEGVREMMERQDLLQLLSERITELPDVQKKVLAFYYFEGMRFAEIAEVFDLTESRVCQIHKQAVARLRTLLRAERP